MSKNRLRLPEDFGMSFEANLENYRNREVYTATTASAGKKHANRPEDKREDNVI